jgi:hypothetical protein
MGSFNSMEKELSHVAVDVLKGRLVVRWPFLTTMVSFMHLCHALDYAKKNLKRDLLY